MRTAFALAFLLAAAPVGRAQTPDSTGAPADTVAPPPVSADPLTGEVATDPAPTYTSLDARAVRAVYRVEALPFAAVMRAANESSVPVFAGAASAMAGVALVRGTTYRPAVRMAASEAGALGVAYLLKNVLRRPRPYRTMTEIRPRDRRHTGEAPFDSYSFPSGHAATSFAIATSLTLTDRRLAAPAYVWATAVSVSRVWHGVHYPSDILAGAAIGAGAAAVVHLLLPLPSAGSEAAVPYRLVVPL